MLRGESGRARPLCFITEYVHASLQSNGDSLKPSSSWFRPPSEPDSCLPSTLPSPSINSHMDRGTEKSTPCTHTLPQRTIPITLLPLTISHHKEAQRSTPTKIGLRLRLALHPAMWVLNHHQLQDRVCLNSSSLVVNPHEFILTKTASWICF